MNSDLILWIASKKMFIIGYFPLKYFDWSGWGKMGFTYSADRNLNLWEGSEHLLCILLPFPTNSANLLLVNLSYKIMIQIFKDIWHPHLFKLRTCEYVMFMVGVIKVAERIKVANQLSLIEDAPVLYQIDPMETQGSLQWEWRKPESQCRTDPVSVWGRLTQHWLAVKMEGSQEPWNAAAFRR